MADERKDKRGAAPGSRAGTEAAGKVGNLPHERSEAAADLITRLASYGLPQACISNFLEWARDHTPIDLGQQGYSIDTIKRHYLPELESGKLPAKELLMMRAYQMAFMDQLPEGVTPDRAYAVSADKLKFLLNVQHGVAPIQSHRHGGPGGGPIPIVALQALNDEELDWLERITAKLAVAAAAGSDQG